MINASVSIKLIALHNSKEVRYEYVDKIIKIIETKKLNYIVGPSETTIDGNIDDLLSLINELFTIIKSFKWPIYLMVNFLFNPVSEIDSIKDKIEKYNN